MKTGKVWGETSVLLQTPMVEVHTLRIMPHSTCSLHKHACKWNAFYVVNGLLFIEAHKNAYDLADVTTLGAGEFTTLPPGEFHRFYTRDVAVECLEIYYPAPLSEDIIRKTIGATNVHH